MNYRRSFAAQRQRLLFLTVYLALSSAAAFNATTAHDIRNADVPAVTATVLHGSASCLGETTYAAVLQRNGQCDRVGLNCPETASL